MRADRATIETLVPHAGAMCLWDEAIDWNATRIVVRTQGHRDPAHPLRCGDRLHAIHLCEYGAQAMAVHGGLLARERGTVAPPGMLVALRDVTFATARIDGIAAPLRVEARVQFADANGSLYAFSVSADGVPLASGRVQVMTTPA